MSEASKRGLMPGVLPHEDNFNPRTPIRHWLACGHVVDLALSDLSRIPHEAVWCEKCQQYSLSQRHADVTPV